jgi:uncharacterized protein YegP (UPF0339 family)
MLSFRIEMIRDNEGKWWWKMYVAGKIVATSGHGYSTKGACKTAIVTTSYHMEKFRNSDPWQIIRAL